MRNYILNYYEKILKGPKNEYFDPENDQNDPLWRSQFDLYFDFRTHLYTLI